MVISFSSGQKRNLVIKKESYLFLPVAAFFKSYLFLFGDAARQKQISYLADRPAEALQCRSGKPEASTSGPED